MTLPQETRDRINTEAEKYGFVVPYDGSNKFYNEDKVKGYQAGATEWAGRAQPVIDAAEKVAKMFAHAGDNQACAICQLAKALQQWKDGKEVTNER
jgi:hypothetical protein